MVSLPMVADWASPEELLVNPTTQLVAAYAATPASTIPSATEMPLVSQDNLRPCALDTAASPVRLAPCCIRRDKSLQKRGLGVDCVERVRSQYPSNTGRPQLSSTAHRRCASSLSGGEGHLHDFGQIAAHDLGDVFVRETLSSSTYESGSDIPSMCG